MILASSQIFYILLNCSRHPTPPPLLNRKTQPYDCVSRFLMCNIEGFFPCMMHLRQKCIKKTRKKLKKKNPCFQAVCWVIGGGGVGKLSSFDWIMGTYTFWIERIINNIVHTYTSLYLHVFTGFPIHYLISDVQNKLDLKQLLHVLYSRFWHMQRSLHYNTLMQSKRSWLIRVLQPKNKL